MHVVLLIAAASQPAAATPPIVLTPTGHEVPGAPDAAPSLPVTSGDAVENPLDWPDLAGIVIQGYVSCTGTLIAPNVVITAGHCMRPRPSSVVLGTNDYRDPGETIDVIEGFEYPNSYNTYDVGVLVLERDSTYEPRRIATSCLREFIHDGAEAIVVGYGATNASGTAYTPLLQWGTTEISDADCSDINSGCNDSVSPNGELGGGIAGSDACYGDSGGPLYLPTPHGTFLAGVVSRGFYGADCGDGGVWVRPDAPDLHDWMEEVTGVTLPPPACGTAPALYAVKNHPGYSQIDPEYPDGEPFSYEIATRPLNGGATVSSDGVVTFTPENGFKGEDQVTVNTIAHDGSVAEVVIPIKIVSRSTYRQQTGESVPGACSTGGLDLSGLALLVALAAVRRRR